VYTAAQRRSHWRRLSVISRDQTCSGGVVSTSLMCAEVNPQDPLLSSPALTSAMLGLCWLHHGESNNPVEQAHLTVTVIAMPNALP
jgi:hypothetical protein